MTKQAHDKIAAGLAEALAIARGAEPAGINTGAPSPASLRTLGAALAEIERQAAEIDRLRAALRMVFLSPDHDEAVKMAGDAIKWYVVAPEPPHAPAGLRGAD